MRGVFSDFATGTSIPSQPRLLPRYALILRRWPKSTRRLLKELQATGELWPEDVLEMKHLYPNWVVALWSHKVALSCAFKKWYGPTNGAEVSHHKPEIQLSRWHPL